MENIMRNLKWKKKDTDRQVSGVFRVYFLCLGHVHSLIYHASLCLALCRIKYLVSWDSKPKLELSGWPLYGESVFFNRRRQICTRFKKIETLWHRLKLLVHKIGVGLASVLEHFYHDLKRQIMDNRSKRKMWNVLLQGLAGDSRSNVLD